MIAKPRPPCPARPLPAPAAARATLSLLRPGRVSYADGLTLQQRLLDRLAARPADAGALLLLEHEPVITLGRNAKPANLLVPREVLEHARVDLVQTDRGGDATYHGPGQLVAYPIVRLRSLRRSLRDYVAGLEETMIRLAAEYGIVAARRPGAVGVWVGESKLGFLGIHVSRGLAWHGIALNVTTDLDAYRWINPCGMPGCPVTSLAECLRRSLCPEEVEEAYARAFVQVFGLALRPAPLRELAAPDGAWEPPGEAP
ncbi:MAG: lipoyl(octanoyl) transferase LipB [Planctomycetes bacterium]|nr:lipoyl(octanoyl) transferase LipB [Planctomycetota bacterium]